MNLQERAKEVVVDNNGIAKSADFVAAGIRAVDVVNLCNAGFLNRVRHGYYQLAEQGVSSEEQLLATLIPKGIVCVESALFHYGYSDFAPRKLCDCFKYRSRLDNEIFNKAINAYAKDNKKNLNNLSAYSQKLRVYKKVTELMEVLLNG